jgi:hypothetical protein
MPQDVIVRVHSMSGRARTRILFLDRLWQVIDDVDGEPEAADHADVGDHLAGVADYEQEDLNEDVNGFEIEDMVQEQIDDEAINANGAEGMFAGNEEAEHPLELAADEPVQEDEPLDEAMDAHQHDADNEGPNEGPGHRYNLRRQQRVDHSSMFASAATTMTPDGPTAGQRGESASGGARPPQLSAGERKTKRDQPFRHERAAESPTLPWKRSPWRRS